MWSPNKGVLRSKGPSWNCCCQRSYIACSKRLGSAEIKKVKDFPSAIKFIQYKIPRCLSTRPLKIWRWARWPRYVQWLAAMRGGTCPLLARSFAVYLLEGVWLGFERLLCLVIATFVDDLYKCTKSPPQPSLHSHRHKCHRARLRRCPQVVPLPWRREVVPPSSRQAHQASIPTWQRSTWVCS